MARHKKEEQRTNSNHMAGGITVHSDLLCRQMQHILPLKELITSTNDGFPVVMYGSESWATKKSEHRRRCFWTVVLEKTIESSLDSKEIKPVNPKGNQPWILIERTDAEAEATTLWPRDEKTNSLEKTLMLRKTERKGKRKHRMKWLDSITTSMDMSFSNEPLLVFTFAAFLGLPTTWAPVTIITPTEALATGPQSQMCAHHWLWPPPLLIMIPRLWNQVCCWRHK